MKLGELEVRSISGGRFRLDGGGIFGVVPKGLWERKCPCDDRNRVALDANCLLVRAGTNLALIDSGYGSKTAPRQREHCQMQDGNPLVENLARAGVLPEEITAVVLTHLHFDHAGGCTFRDDSGRLRPVFRRARHFVQRTEWEDATSGAPELAGTYFPDDFLPLSEAGLVELIEGEAEILPGITARLMGGHTRGHQLVSIESGPSSGVYISEFCPLVAHLRPRWTMSYDLFPLTVRKLKLALLSEIARQGSVMFFNHDPAVKAATVRQNKEGDFVIVQQYDLQ
jgi:glyoxylase-like metal-dependent hydrolase (beta-lactamase superfamily II)